MLGSFLFFYMVVQQAHIRFVETNLGLVREQCLLEHAG